MWDGWLSVEQRAPFGASAPFSIHALTCSPAYLVYVYVVRAHQEDTLEVLGITSAVRLAVDRDRSKRKKKPKAVVGGGGGGGSSKGGGGGGSSSAAVFAGRGGAAASGVARRATPAAAAAAAAATSETAATLPRNEAAAAVVTAGPRRVHQTVSKMPALLKLLVEYDEAERSRSKIPLSNQESARGH